MPAVKAFYVFKKNQTAATVTMKYLHAFGSVGRYAAYLPFLRAFFNPPPVNLFTVAQARASAVLVLIPFSS